MHLDKAGKAKKKPHDEWTQLFRRKCLGGHSFYSVYWGNTSDILSTARKLKTPKDMVDSLIGSVKKRQWTQCSALYKQEMWIQYRLSKWQWESESLLEFSSDSSEQRHSYYQKERLCPQAPVLGSIGQFIGVKTSVKIKYPSVLSYIDKTRTSDFLCSDFMLNTSLLFTNLVSYTIFFFF